MSTAIKTVTGMVSDGFRMAKAPITVRFTSDKSGESLYLEYNGNIMLHVAYEDIKPIIQNARKSR